MSAPPLVAPAGPPPRGSQLPLPAYRHVPGVTPHPVTDPTGHSHGVPPPVVPTSEALLPDGWRRCPLYLYGVDLWNRAFLWEAHEAWEAVWNAVGHKTRPGLAIQGLIQLAAALLQHHRGLEPGALGNHRKGVARLAPIAAALPSGERYLGIDLPAFLQQVDDWLAGGKRYPFLRLAPPTGIPGRPDRLAGSDLEAVSTSSGS